MISDPPATSRRRPGRIRRLRGSVERQTAQSQPMTGTPVEVPLPSIVRRSGVGAFGAI